jgi:hypothetical protein
MKKIITVFDGTHYSGGAMNFILDLNHLSPVSVTGIFLNAVDSSALWANPMIPGAAINYMTLPSDTARTRQLQEQHMIKFEQECMRNDIPFRIHDDTDGNLFEELKKESKFADLMVISSELFYKQFGGQPNDYLKEVLHNSECPIMLVPENYVFPACNILTYDGTDSSVHAIKQFAYVLPELCKNRTILVSENGHTGLLPDQIYIEELTLRHFQDLSIHIIEKNEQIDFSKWVGKQPVSIIVAGAYGRSEFSNLFKKSFVYELIKEHRSPIFVAHK